MRRLFDAAERLRSYLVASSGDPVGAADQALADVCAAAKEIAELAAPYDAWDVLEAVRLMETPFDPESYKETEDTHSAAVIEIAGLILSSRPHRGGTAPDEDGHRARADHVIDDVLRLARSALEIGSMVPLLRISAAGDVASSLQRGAVLREIFVRSLSYVHMEEDALGGLFGDAAIESICRAAAGCTVDDVRSVFNAMTELHDHAWSERFEAIRQFGDNSLSEYEKYREDPANYELSAERNDQIVGFWTAAWADFGDAATFSPLQIAKKAGLDPPVVDSVLKLFSLPFANRDPVEPVRDFFEGRSPFRTRPILRDGDDFAVIHGSVLVSSIRPRMEEAIKSSSGWEAYQKHRGGYVEDTALDLLEAIFPGVSAHRSLKYFVPDPQKSATELTPTQYTKLVEGDGLLIVDDVAIVLEAKSGALTETARSGDVTRLTGDLKKIVADAADQAQRTRDRIEIDGGLRLRDESWLDLSHIREIHSIAVSLEDLSGIATVTSELVGAGILTSAHLPWTVSLLDLRVISELVERPAEFLLYLRRRNDPNVTRLYHAIDELDFFLEFYAKGLYVQPDPQQIREELPQFGEPRVGTVRRFERQRLELLSSRTDRLDAWYFYRLGIRETPAEKPRFHPDPDLALIVDRLAEAKAPGWLRVGATLLDRSSQTQRDLGRYPRQLAALTRGDGSSHDVTAIGGARAEESHVFTFSTFGRHETIEDALRRIRGYVTMKKHQAGVAFAMGMLFDPRDPVAPIGTVYLNDPPGEDTELDRLIGESGLRPLSEMTRQRMPQPGKPGRVTPKKRRA